MDTSELNIDSRGARRVLSALCHFSGLLPVYGIVFSAAVWASNRRCDWPVAFQALQAMIAQALFHILLLIPMLGWLLAGMLEMIGAPMSSVLHGLNWWFTGLIFIIAWVAFLFATFQTYESGSFLYPIIGKRLALRCWASADAKD